MIASAARLFDDAPVVASVRVLVRAGWTWSAIRAQLDAHRWQRIGRAVIRHNGPPTSAQLRAAALINCGPRSALTAFTALEDWGLTGWSRPRIHVYVPRGARLTARRELGLRPHYTDDWRAASVHPLRSLHRAAPAAVLAAATFERPRPACGVLAATVQQRLARPTDLVDEITRHSRVRHRAHLLAAAHDITQGAQALSEIDLAVLCRHAGLPPPVRQAVRVERGGRRRYLDAEWRLPDGRRLVVEVDGALHLAVASWWADQLRQNELVIVRDAVLRYPSVILRSEPAVVADQLRRAGLA